MERVGAARLRREPHTLTHGWTTKDGISAGVFVWTYMELCEQGKVCCSWLTREHAPAATRIHPAGVQALENAEFPCWDLPVGDNGRRDFCRSRGGKPKRKQPQMESYAGFFCFLAFSQNNQSEL